MRTGTYGKFVQYDSQRRVCWTPKLGEIDGPPEFHPEDFALWREELWLPNAVTNEGEEFFLEVCLPETETVPANYYAMLFNDSGIAETDTLSTVVGEPSTNGYARQTIASNSTGFPTSGLDAGDWRIVSQQKTFSATGGTWGPVDHFGLATTSDNTGKFILYIALSSSRTVDDGGSLKYTATIKAQ